VATELREGEVADDQRHVADQFYVRAVSLLNITSTTEGFVSIYQQTTELSVFAPKTRELVCTGETVYSCGGSRETAIVSSSLHCIKKRITDPCI
jgi:hypothetical protein